MAKLGIGDRVPDAVFKYLGPDGVKDMSSEELFGGGSVLVIGVMGAFTPVCTRQHLPEFIPFQAMLKDQGIIDRFACVSVADPFVLRAWAQQLDTPDDMLMLTDTNAAFADALGVTVDLSRLGLGVRSNRYALRAKDGVIDLFNCEDKVSDFDKTSRAEIEKLILG